jgi:hypothetical protein
MPAFTAATLVEQARLQSDERPGGSSAFISDSEVLGLINQACEDLYTELLAATGGGGQGWFETSTTFPTVAGTANYALPTTHQQTVQLLINWSTSEIEPIHQFEWEEKPRLQTDALSWDRWLTKGFRIIGDDIYIYPTPSTVETITHVYIPEFTWAAIGGSIDLKVSGWQKYVVFSAASEMRAIRELDNSRLEAKQQQSLERILTIASDRAVREAAHIVDVCPEGPRGLWYPPGVYD